MHSLAPRFLVITLLSLGACQAGTSVDRAFDQTPAPIIDGQLEPGQDGVVLLYHNWYGVMCTGTIISPRVVLTARHCVKQNEGAGSLYEAAGWSVMVGPNMNNTIAEYGVDEVRTTPGATVDNNDIAVMITSSTMTQTPYPVVQELTNGFIGSDVYLIGYGVSGCPNGDSGTKYRTTDQVEGWYDSNTYATLGNGANSGDSGGPVFDMNYNLVGVMVAVDGQCQGYTVVTRADHFIPLISQAILDSGGCFPTGPEVCGDGLDNDCNDLVDDGCTATGQPCAVDTDCLERLCVNLGGGLACAEPCDAAEPLATCGIGGYCREVDCGRGACAAGTPGAGQILDACQADTDCESLYCRTLPDGIARCGARCDLAGADCFLGEACLAQGDTCGICGPDTMVTGVHGLGEACAANTECASGLCIADGVNHYCSTGCTTSETCPEDYHCRSGFCVRGVLGLAGDPCEVQADCHAGLSCYSHGDLQYCTEFDCDDASNPCPTGYSCALEGVTMVCTADKLPVGEPCTAHAECESGACLTFNGASSCALSCNHQEPCPSGTFCEASDTGLVGCAPNTVLPGHPNVNDNNHGGGGDGGCQSAPGNGTSLLWILALGLALALRRRP